MKFNKSKFDDILTKLKSGHFHVLEIRGGKILNGRYKLRYEIIQCMENMYDKIKSKDGQ